MNKILITGGTGFFGSHIAKKMSVTNNFVYAVGKQHENLMDSEAAYRLIRTYQPNVVIHAAALSGGVTYNKNHPDTIFYNNTIMTLNLMRAVGDLGVNKFVGIISSCAYPDKIGDIEEKDFWNGLPHKSIRFFGLQKRNMLAYAMALQQVLPQKIFTCAVVNNLYGPEDTFDYERTKVVGAMIRRFVEAKEAKAPSVQCLGDGSPKRQFTYVEDAAEAISKVADLYNDNSPINITTYNEVTIKELAETVADLVGYDGNILWETDGIKAQESKRMSGNLAEKLLDFKTTTSLRDGLKKTIQWYLYNREYANNK